jgi:hypothetical protein
LLVPSLGVSFVQPSPSEVLSPSGSSAIACLMPSSVIQAAYFLPLGNANGFEKPISIVQVIGAGEWRLGTAGFQSRPAGSVRRRHHKIMSAPCG